ncbi:hypothetical protein BDV30DRAFT_65423 [Aspergillus minisclerotigenes]|uniref:Uncharacterized protein n=1 Tax=Aspergillus minisclerotigenes TaxID=656917 RepID=A0A5N6JBC1_9EURO|nr:hypothetical protein BDV30DRAFT_65423 [Aspergillus minisclerotigenes]
MSTAPLRILRAFQRHQPCLVSHLPAIGSSSWRHCFLLLVHRRKMDIREMALLVPLVIITTIDWAMWSLLYSDPSIADLHCLLDSLRIPLDGYRTVPV